MSEGLGERTLWRSAAALFGMTLLIYLSRPLLTGGPFLANLDNLPTELIPISLLKEGNFDLDEFFPAGADKPYVITRIGEHCYSASPVGGAVLLTPVFAVLSWIGVDVLGNHAVRQWVVGTMAALLSALSVLIVYWTYARRGPRRALVIAAIYGFGTGVWPMCSLDLWQHTFGVLFMSLGVLCLERGWDNPRWLGWLGLPVGLLFFVRPGNALLVCLFGVAVLVRDRRRLVMFALLSVPFLAAILTYNLSLSGNLFGEYRDEAAAINPLSTMMEGLPGLLVSPARGLLLYSPVVLLGIFSLTRTLEPERRSLRLILAAMIVGQLLLYGSYGHWYGGYCYGPRFLLETMPACAALMWHAWPRIVANLRGRVAFTALAAWSVLASAIGYVIPWGLWCGHSDLDRCHGRLWDLRDNPLVTAFASLPPRSEHELRPGGQVIDLDGVSVEFGRGWTQNVVGRMEAMGSEAELLIDFRGRPVGMIVLMMQGEAGLSGPQMVTARLDGAVCGRITLSAARPQPFAIAIRKEDLAGGVHRLTLEFSEWRRRSLFDIRLYAAQVQGIEVGLW